MAKQIGSAFIGTVDGLSFYYNRYDGYLVRQTGGVTSEQYRTQKRYQAARDNSSEFCTVSRTGKLIRQALGDFLAPVKDGTMVNRLNKELVVLKQHDRTHLLGQRRPDVMMPEQIPGSRFPIFQFNRKAELFNLTKTYPQLEKVRKDGLPHVSSANPSPGCRTKDIRLNPSTFPEGTTHAGLTLIRTVIDFRRQIHKTVSSRMTVVAGDEPVDLSVSLTGVDAFAGIELVCVQVLFFRKENGDLVQLKEKVHSLGIIAVTKIDEDQYTIRRDGMLPACVAKRNRKKHDCKLSLRSDQERVYIEIHPVTGMEGEYVVFRAEGRMRQRIVIDFWPEEEEQPIRCSDLLLI